ncbi:glycosyltransferase family 9 protein [Falsiroseomonas sp. E2-1-a20]|uniref:glycosyltransferase family 9 protein n=1 Tax=Falsiroseomonas sp. E2-1-a20 TaxID=3239300 RepID=UPI003F3E9DE0
MITQTRSLSARLAAAPGDWLCLSPLSLAGLAHARTFLERERKTIPDRAAAVQAEPGGPHLWRRDYLLALLRAGVVAEDAGLAALAEAASRNPYVFGPGAARSARHGVALLISAFGARRFGGAEHFLDQMAELYGDLGYRPLIVAMRGSISGEEEEGPGALRIAGHPDALLRLALEREAVVAHVVSGLGYEVAAALRFLDIRLIFGVHFWRELFHPRSPGAGYYPDFPSGHTPRSTFPLLLADMDAAYANSDFTRDVVERQFGARLPVVPSLPEDLPAGAARPSHAERDCVLLANARDDKGFGLLLELAGLLPELHFLAIANQSSAAAARAAVAERGVTNIEVLPQAQDMTPLYRRARAVLVPSYRFVESFSRVVVEAQRHGVPVLGSDRGNVPRLLRESGLALPPAPAAWADALEPLWRDPEHWQAVSEAALRNAARLPFSGQRARLRKLLAGLEAPMLVGVGSGIGNMLNATPLIRNLARHHGAPVDVVVASDWPGSLGIMAAPEHVRHVFDIADLPVRRHYATVFLTHSFGRLLPSFRADRVVSSRSWADFTAESPLHEAEFNLAAAKHLLGLDYAPEDVRAAFCGGLHYTVPKGGRLIGLHSGSKAGIWATKRWPFYAEVAVALQEEGWEVASFGTADEHVPGTLDLTGGSIEEMAVRMLGCRAFVANDSGVMNVANALGIPLVALFGPTAPHVRGPLGHSSVTLAVDAPCAPCETKPDSRRFLGGDCRCIGQISLPHVLEALRKLLEDPAARTVRA